MTPRELAAMLNDCERGEEISGKLEIAAKVSGLVVVFGHSDDCMEFRGAINDEFGCYDGGTAYLTPAGLLQNKCYSDECPYHAEERQKAATIEAVWCGDSDPHAWKYRTAIPHETFEVIDDGAPYCVGIVFALADVGRHDQTPREDDAEMRALFEAFIREMPFYAYESCNEVLERDDADGGYLDSSVHGAWLAWQARGALK